MDDNYTPLTGRGRVILAAFVVMIVVTAISCAVFIRVG